MFRPPKTDLYTFSGIKDSSTATAPQQKNQFSGSNEHAGDEDILQIAKTEIQKHTPITSS